MILIGEDGSSQIKIRSYCHHVVKLEWPGTVPVSLREEAYDWLPELLHGRRGLQYSRRPRRLCLTYLKTSSERDQTITEELFLRLPALPQD